MCAYIVCTGNYPFKEPFYHDLRYENFVKKKRFNKNLSVKLNMLIMGCLQFNPLQRFHLD